VLTVLSGFKTIDRNKDWKNDRTLFLHDVKTSPNSVLILGNAGSASIDLADAEKDSVKRIALYKQAIKFFDKAISIHPRFSNGYENRGVAYYKMGYTDIAVANWDTTKMYHPGHPELPYVFTIASNYYYRDGIKYGKAGEHELAIQAFMKAAHCKPTEPDIWYNIGYANMMGAHYEKAITAYENSLRFSSKNPNARQYLEKCKAILAQGGVQPK
jgi:tetratricopeptide (TPR) repeat protein